MDIMIFIQRKGMDSAILAFLGKGGIALVCRYRSFGDDYRQRDLDGRDYS